MVDAEVVTMVTFRMTKLQAIQLFSSVRELACVLGVTRQAIYKWPDELSQEQVDRVIGAAHRTGRLLCVFPLPIDATAQALGEIQRTEPTPGAEAARQEAA